MNRNSTIAAAVATILGTVAASGAAFALSNPPTPAQAAAAGVTLYIAGSSAAKNAVLGALEGDLCGGASNALVYSSVSDKNFFAVSCAPASGVAGSDGSQYFTVYYRDEGGSVSGVLPLANNVPINQLNLSATSFITCANANTCSPTVLGATEVNGTDDSFGGAVSKQYVQLGISDVEPAALVVNNYPTAYSTSAWGPVNQAGVAGVAATPAFGEVYGIFVNTGSSSAFTESPLALSQQMVQQIFAKTITDWSNVTDVSGNPVTNGSVPVTIVNREKGSGSRAATDLLIMGDTCQTVGGQLKETKGTNTDYFSTGDVLAAASSVAGAITYATIDQSAANLTQVALNGVTPSSLAAATGRYPFWVEAQLEVTPQTLPAATSSLISFLEDEIAAIGTAPHVADVVAIPNVAGNTASVTTTSTANTAPSSLTATLGAATIYVNNFTRNAVTCALPASVL
jgi:hypothetical protein